MTRLAHATTICCSVLALALIFYSCRESTPSSRTPAPLPKSAQGSDREPDYDSLMEVVLGLQNRVHAEPGSGSLVPQLVSASFDSLSGSFITVGKGVANPEHPQAAQPTARQRAAGADAKRWALYMKAWHTGDTRPFGETIEGQITYSRVLAEKLEGDTLYQLVQVPIGSVVVQ